jgi:hypothetical protein
MRKKHTVICEEIKNCATFAYKNGYKKLHHNLTKIIKIS